MFGPFETNDQWFIPEGVPLVLVKRVTVPLDGIKLLSYPHWIVTCQGELSFSIYLN